MGNPSPLSFCHSAEYIIQLFESQAIGFPPFEQARGLLE